MIRRECLTPWAVLSRGQRSRDQRPGLAAARDGRIEQSRTAVEEGPLEAAPFLTAGACTCLRASGVHPAKRSAAAGAATYVTTANGCVDQAEARSTRDIPRSLEVPRTCSIRGSVMAGRTAEMNDKRATIEPVPHSGNMATAATSIPKPLPRTEELTR